MNPFTNPAADVVEVHRGEELDLVAVIGESRGVAFVSIGEAPAVRVSRHRSGDYRCALHGSATNPRCRHIDDAIRAADHLDIEDYGTSTPDHKETA